MGHPAISSRGVVSLFFSYFDIRFALRTFSCTQTSILGATHLETGLSYVAGRLSLTCIFADVRRPSRPHFPAKLVSALRLCLLLHQSSLVRLRHLTKHRGSRTAAQTASNPEPRQHHASFKPNVSLWALEFHSSRHSCGCGCAATLPPANATFLVSLSWLRSSQRHDSCIAGRAWF